VTSYQEFLDHKTQLAHPGGFEPVHLPEFLFPFQRHLVEWAVRQGRAALFADCGLGKSPMALVWAENVRRHTGKPVLMVTPLAVGFQLEAEAAKFGVDAAISRDGRVTAPITITNYERLEKFDRDKFGGVVCDESSAIKAFDGTRRAIVTEFLRTVPYRLLATATAAPNDYIELGTSSEALGELGHMDMLNRFFTNKNKTSDTKGQWRGHGNEQGWRFKGHAEEPFWRWVASWARAMRKPSDYGFDDTGFDLPKLIQRTHVVEARRAREGTLFDVPAVGLREEREELRRTIHERCETAAEAIDGARSGVVWCHLNDESALLAKLIPNAVEVTGSDAVEEKEEKLRAFSAGQIPVLVSKPKIGAYGLNWQHCHRVVYFPSHSYEQMYQAIRRCWRFGQKSRVIVDVVTTEGGKNTLANLQRKSAQADQMFTALVRHMTNALNIERGRSFNTQIEVPEWLSK
jgi:helicase-like protein